MCRDGNREPEEVCWKQQWKLRNAVGEERILGGWKDEERGHRDKKKELHRRPIIFTVYEENNCIEGPKNLELAKDANTGEEKRRNVAQDQAIRTNKIKGKLTNRVFHQYRDFVLKGRKKISDVVAASKMLAHKQYQLCRHDRPIVVVNWLICKRYGISTGTKWYEYKPERVPESEKT